MEWTSGRMNVLFHCNIHSQNGRNQMPFLSDTKLIRTTANIATILFVVVVVLQISLAAGILPISMAWGSRESQLTFSLRIASIIAAVLLGMFIYVIRYRAGLVGDVQIPGFIKVVSWIITAFMAFNTLGNITSLSADEKLLFSPVTIILTVACVLVSASHIDSIQPHPHHSIRESSKRTSVNKASLRTRIARLRQLRPRGEKSR